MNPTAEQTAPPAPQLKKTPLNATHRLLKAKMVDFGGWDMPVEYPGAGGGLIAEHLAVRTAAGLFDVSHMGEIQFRGPGALAAVQHITMNDASRLKDGQAHYSALLTPEGTFVDDILVHRLSANDYLLVVNAGTKDKDLAWIRQQVGRFPSAHIADYSAYYSQLALQGPRALETLQKLTKTDLSAIKNYWFTWGTVAGIANVLIARTGYSGEDGFEVYLPADEATTVKVWNEILAAGAEFGVRPCGLGARNTLRLEAGMSLYGHEISDSTNVFEAGLDRWLKLDKGDFVGRSALQAVQDAGGPSRKVIGLEMVERGIARDGYAVLNLEGKEIGVITSGSPSPFLKTNIAFALVPAAVGQSGEDVLVQVRPNQAARAKQVPTPFYKRPKTKV
ncbi:MAG: glycine cleavage system aminomethyltransferase GcvT [Terracidiphilus sp.]|jgi:aminomethyltransferase